MGNFIEEQKQKKLDQILNSGFDLFTNKGFSKTTISEIASAAGVGKGTFYLYFKDKYDLRSLLIQRKAADLLDASYHKMIPAMEKGDVPMTTEDGICFIMEDILDQLNEDRSLLLFLSKNLSWGIFRNALERADQQEGDTEFMKNFRSLIEKSSEQYKDPEIGLFLIVELVSSAGFSSIMYEDPVTLEELKPYLRRCIHDILEAHRI